MCLKSPDCSVEVVDATMMKRCASALGASANARSRQAVRTKRTLQFHGSSPLMNDAASAVDGCAKKRSTGARSARRPALMNRISSPRRRACPRLCVVITILVPLAWIWPTMRFDLARRAGIEVCSGLVEEQHLGLERPRAREREFLLLAARKDTRGPLRRSAQPHGIEHFAARAGRAPQSNPGELEPVGHVADGRAAQHHGPLKHHRLRARPARRRGGRARRFGPTSASASP